jgi:hypothetical protein
VSPTRLWRARKRHDRIDATLRRAESHWELRFVRNDRLLVARRYTREAPARSEAAARLRDLERAGWVTHW